VAVRASLSQLDEITSQFDNQKNPCVPTRHDAADFCILTISNIRNLCLVQPPWCQLPNRRADRWGHKAIQICIPFIAHVLHYSH
jgi:hypothetical protein